MQILKHYDFSPKIGIQTLIEKLLLKCHNNLLEMHDLVEEMGKKIVIEKSDLKIGKQSRLWSLKDIVEVLKNNRVSFYFLDKIIVVVVLLHLY